MHRLFGNELCFDDASQASQPLIEADGSGRAGRAVDSDPDVFHIGQRQCRRQTEQNYRDNRGFPHGFVLSEFRRTTNDQQKSVRPSSFIPLFVIEGS